MNECKPLPASWRGAPRGRVIENQHSTDIGSCLTFSLWTRDEEEEVEEAEKGEEEEEE